jgi:hypothetical protein
MEDEHQVQAGKIATDVANPAFEVHSEQPEACPTVQVNP